MKEGHRYRSLHAAGPLSPREERSPSARAARAPRDFASETFRGFCGRAREGSMESRRRRRRRIERERESARGTGKRGIEVEERVGWEDNSIPVN